MKLFKQNLVVQFSIVSFVILSVLAISISLILSSQLNSNIALLEEHGAAMMAGDMIESTDPFSILSLTRNVRELQRITITIVGGSFVVLYVSLVLIVWNGWRTIVRQQASLGDVNAELRHANEELHESKTRYALAASGTNDGIWDWNLQTDTMYFSPRWKAMLGYGENAIGTSSDEWFSRVHPDDREHLKVEINAHLEGMSEHFEAQYRIRHADGSYRWMLSRGLAVRDEEEQAARMAGSQTDITERKQAEEQLMHDAFHDSLTDLPNRALFMDRLRHAIERAKRREDCTFAVLFMDLDRFKVVNDSLGHTIGDQLLITLADRLKMWLRTVDTVARLGGDEFVILLEDIEGAGEAIHVAERIQGALLQPFSLNGRDVFMTASIGIVLSDIGYDRPEDILRDADIAMYRAKALGKARYQVFDTAMRTRALALLELEVDLRHAVECQELELHYQPIMSLDTNRIMGFEALVRWYHPQHGLVSPAEFIPLAEETGLIVPIGRWVLREACRQVHTWQAHFSVDPPLFVSVNVSAKQLMRPDLVETIQHILQETNLDAGSLKLEITESVLVEDQEVDSIQTRLEQLQALGIQLQIDDFGTGYSSIGYLQHFPIDALKIDRTFVSQLGFGSETSQLVKTILVLARDLNMDVIAEGVETEEQLAQLKSLSCPNGQGFLFARPGDSETTHTLLRQRIHA